MDRTNALVGVCEKIDAVMATLFPRGLPAGTEDFRSGVLSELCSTSTASAPVNVPSGFSQQNSKLSSVEPIGATFIRSQDKTFVDDMRQLLGKETGSVTQIIIASPTGNRIATTSSLVRDRTKILIFELWDTRNGKRLWAYARHSQECTGRSPFLTAFSPDGTCLVIYDRSDDAHLVHLMDISGTEVVEMGTGPCPEDFQTADSLAIHPNLQQLVMAAIATDSTKFILLGDISKQDDIRFSWPVSVLIYGPPKLIYSSDGKVLFATTYLQPHPNVWIRRFSSATGESLGGIEYNTLTLPDRNPVVHGLLQHGDMDYIVLETLLTRRRTSASGRGGSFSGHEAPDRVRKLRVLSSAGESISEHEISAQVNEEANIFVSNGKLLCHDVDGKRIVEFDGRTFTTIAEFLEETQGDHRAVALNGTCLTVVNSLLQFRFIKVERVRKLI
jgi:hypothetical protein